MLFQRPNILDASNPWYRGYLEGYYFGSLTNRPMYESPKTIDEWKKGFKQGEEDFSLELQPL